MAMPVDNILQKMETILSLTRDILAVNKSQDNCVDIICKKLISRGKKLESVDVTNIDNEQIKPKQKETLQAFFHEYRRLDQKMKSFLQELSLNLEQHLSSIKNDQNVSTKYKTKISSSKFLDTQINSS